MFGDFVKMTLIRVIDCNSTGVIRLKTWLESSHVMTWWWLEWEWLESPKIVTRVDLGLPDHLKFFQEHFVVLWLLPFYFTP